jgi:hypothetical protein
MLNPTVTHQEPKTNWHLVIWPVLTLWVVAAIYVFNSDWKHEAGLLLPILMVVTAFVVLLLNAVAGSIAKRQYQLQMLDESSSACLNCGKTDGPLHLLEYHSYVFLGPIIAQFGKCGKYCPQCARVNVDRMFRRTLWGSLFCPPIIAWAWLQRRKILRRLRNESC